MGTNFSHLKHHPDDVIICQLTLSFKKKKKAVTIVLILTEEWLRVDAFFLGSNHVLSAQIRVTKSGFSSGLDKVSVFSKPWLFPPMLHV